MDSIANIPVWLLCAVIFFLRVMDVTLGTLRTVAIGTAALGLTSGALGAFAVLRRQSLLGDAVSHAALPGIVLAFLLTGSKELLVLVGGAFAAGCLHVPTEDTGWGSLKALYR